MVTMSERPSGTLPTTRLYLPSAGAAGFVRMFASRDTRHCKLTGNGLLNRFPAAAYCVLTWFLEGSARLVSCGGAEVDELQAGCTLCGCHTFPFASRNCGDTHAFMAAFYPDAFHALFGIELAPLQNRFVDARTVLPAHGRDLVDAVFAATSDGERQQLVEQYVVAHAGSTRLPPWTRMRRLGNRLSLAMASAMMGVGPRQLQRLALRQAGANFQTLLRLGRGERSFLAGLHQHRAGKQVDWAEHALAADYADQSHMARDCKANTGRTPAQLARDVLTEEADWIYRLELPLDEDNTPTRSA
jgi:AraC-like DNA-binding protein